MLLAAPDSIAGGSGFGPSSSTSGAGRSDEPGRSAGSSPSSCAAGSRNLIRRLPWRRLGGRSSPHVRRWRSGRIEARAGSCIIFRQEGGGFGGRGLEIFGD